jgi:hypothetical protein
MRDLAAVYYFAVGGKSWDDFVRDYAKHGRDWRRDFTFLLTVAGDDGERTGGPGRRGAAGCGSDRCRGGDGRGGVSD